MPKPWSADPVFQNTYFCNVHREDDKVTKWIRNFYSQFYQDPMFDANIAFSRFINWPESLEAIGFLHGGDIYDHVERRLLERQAQGETTFGPAYIVSTNGLTLPKATYVAKHILPGLETALRLPLAKAPWRVGGVAANTLKQAHSYLTGIYGVASFMAGQIIGDMKNTPGHPLATAPDYFDWACHGPGSLRGLSWIFHGDGEHSVKQTFYGDMRKLRSMLEIPSTQIDEQDLQNCLCEFSKYCKVKTGQGRSKRNYNGR